VLYLTLERSPGAVPRICAAWTTFPLSCLLASHPPHLRSLEFGPLPCHRQTGTSASSVHVCFPLIFKGHLPPSFRIAHFGSHNELPFVQLTSAPPCTPPRPPSRMLMRAYFFPLSLIRCPVLSPPFSMTFFYCAFWSSSPSLSTF